MDDKEVAEEVVEERVEEREAKTAVNSNHILIKKSYWVVKLCFGPDHVMLLHLFSNQPSNQ